MDRDIDRSISTQTISNILELQSLLNFLSELLVLCFTVLCFAGSLLLLVLCFAGSSLPDLKPGLPDLKPGLSDHSFIHSFIQNEQTWEPRPLKKNMGAQTPQKKHGSPDPSKKTWEPRPQKKHGSPDPSKKTWEPRPQGASHGRKKHGSPDPKVARS